jgi:spore maturation protein SpmB
MDLRRLLKTCELSNLFWCIKQSLQFQKIRTICWWLSGTAAAEIIDRLKAYCLDSYIMLVALFVVPCINGRFYKLPVLIRYPVAIEVDAVFF